MSWLRSVRASCTFFFLRCTEANNMISFLIDWIKYIYSVMTTGSGIDGKALITYDVFETKNREWIEGLWIHCICNMKRIPRSDKMSINSINPFLIELWCDRDREKDYVIVDRLTAPFGDFGTDTQPYFDNPERVFVASVPIRNRSLEKKIHLGPTKSFHLLDAATIADVASLPCQWARSTSHELS